MPDVLTFSPEACYGSKGNIIPQKAYYVNRAFSGAGSLAGSTGTAIAGTPTAESTAEDHVIAVVDASFVGVAGAGTRIQALVDTGA